MCIASHLSIGLLRSISGHHPQKREQNSGFFRCIKFSVVLTCSIRVIETFYSLANLNNLLKLTRVEHTQHHLSYRKSWMADNSTLRWGLCLYGVVRAKRRTKRKDRNNMFAFCTCALKLKIERNDDIILNQSKDGKLARALEWYTHNLCAQKFWLHLSATKLAAPTLNHLSNDNIIIFYR